MMWSERVASRLDNLIADAENEKRDEGNGLWELGEEGLGVFKDVGIVQKFWLDFVYDDKSSKKVWKLECFLPFRFKANKHFNFCWRNFQNAPCNYSKHSKLEQNEKNCFNNEISQESRSEIENSSKAVFQWRHIRMAPIYISNTVVS